MDKRADQSWMNSSNLDVGCEYGVSLIGQRKTRTTSEEDGLDEGRPTALEWVGTPVGYVEGDMWRRRRVSETAGGFEQGRPWA